MANIQAYFDVIYEIEGNGEDITRISISLQWEESRAIKVESDLIVNVTFKLQQESVMISQKLPASRIIYEGGQYNLDLEGEYVAIGTFNTEDITEVMANVYYIAA